MTDRPPSIETAREKLKPELWSSFNAKALFFLTALAALFFILLSAKSALSVLAGGAAVLANNVYMRQKALKALQPANRTTALRKILVGYYVRFAITAVLLYLLFKFDLIEPLGLLFGLSAMVAAVFLRGLRNALKSGSNG